MGRLQSSSKSKKHGIDPTLATVIDIITNEEHVGYDRNGINVGQIKFKYTEWGGQRSSEGTALTAMPLESEVQAYPLIGESVLVQTVRGKRYYSRRVNISKRLQRSNSSRYLNKLKPSTSKSDTRDRTQQAIGGQLATSQVSNQVADNLSHENYQSREPLHNLKHFDGDILIQNRYGSTLRFGSSQLEDALNQYSQPNKSHSKTVLGPTKPLTVDTTNNDPIIIMRVGEREDAKTTTKSIAGDYGLVVEDINRDDSSFVLSSNQQINFHFATTDSDVHFRSSKRFTTKSSIAADITGEPDGLTKTPLMGNQSLLNSNRLVFNAKEDNIILSTGQDLISLTNKDTIFDTGEDFVVGAKQIYFLKNSTSSVNKREWSRAGYKEKYDSAALAGEVIRVFKELLKELLKPGAFMSPMGPCNASGLKIAVPNVETNPFDINKIKSYLVRIEK